MDQDPIKKIIHTAAPQLWKNFKFFELGAPLHNVFECRLFSDAFLLGEARDLGPISVLNGVPHRRYGDDYAMKPVAILRTFDHRPMEAWSPKETSSFSHYHGGQIFDEAAALLGLILDVRVAAGLPERDFLIDDDPFGRPTLYHRDFEPSYNPGRRSEQMPRLLRQTSMEPLSRLTTLGQLCEADATALVKAARMFQNATWIANADPAMAWLMYVSAAETTAVRYDTGASAPDIDPATSYPKIVKILEKSGRMDLLPEILGALRPQTRALAKFLHFIARFSPRPPEPRPQHGAFDFSELSVRAAMKSIYTHRSNALHSGTAMPLPMCLPPSVGKQGEVVETPWGVGTETRDANWLHDETPMLLGTFAHIVREAILGWWLELEAAPIPRPPGDPAH
ncbi:hypothetical protein M3484_05095 [Pseudomonas sp. GX19020]|uniref:hypothetical protein n=1 Tax=Pseudomonas sp. GX19020 TaxID=2942277 RepID=UPI002018E3AE|nr:hypothetical protein [Pseudomonas sp. GX19020]MCL4065938.1 hypothetical protein [Pseudomonas sp. GX19020]